MSTNRRYIDINSAYRNRNTYPNVCDFVVEMNTISQSNNPDSAKDPILLSFPYETNLLQGGSTITQIVLSIESSNIINFYKNSYLEIAGNYRRITAYNPSTKVATVTPAFPVAYPALTLYTIRYELPILTGVTSAAALTTNTIVLSLAASSENNFYVGTWVFVPGATPPSSYQWYRITAYDGVTRTATIAGNFTSIIGIGINFQILRFSYDNVKSLKYYGTETNTNNPITTQISLVNLIVPNLEVANGYGGNLQNYPFLYVCLYSEKGITYNNPIISNTPASDKALFKVPVTYLQSTSFLTLGYSGMTQFINFRTNDDLRLQILLPDGSPLQFETGNVNLFSPGLPIPSNPITQIQAIFEVQRIV